jgi:manganese transport protein
VTAAFIGPGTVTTASTAGANFGFALVWTLVFSIAATIVLQEMSARLGLATGRGLGEAIRQSLSHPLTRWVATGLIVLAIAFGNAAFQTGNITGAALGLESLSGVSPRPWCLVIGVVAFALLASDAYRLIQGLLIALVVLMSMAFVGAAFLVQPNFADLVTAIFSPHIPSGALITSLAMVGTTVVPYNLFLHASAVREKWPADVPLSQSLPQARVDTLFSVSLGGMVTLAIMMTAAAVFFQKGTQIENAADMAAQLEPLLGPVAKSMFAFGLLAAGLTSAVTAPLAAAYALRGVLGWAGGRETWRFRIVWILPQK